MDKLLLAILATHLFSSFDASASCASEAQKAKGVQKQAKGISDGAKANEAGAAANASSQAGQNINSNAGLSSGASAACASGYGSAVSKLTGLKSQCNVNCQPTYQGEDCSSCNNAKSECNKDLASQIGQNSAGQQQCQNAKEGADKTGEESKGQMPQMPQMPSGGEEPPPESPLAEDQSGDCSRQDSYSNPDCNEKTVAECSNGANSEKCETFGFRYCTPSSAGGTGEGIGSEMCKERLANQFCKSPANSKCPSCKNMQIKDSPICDTPGAPCVAQTTEQQAAEAKESCPTDPILADPKVAEMGGGGGLGGSGATGGGAVGGSLPGVVAEEKKSGTTGNTYKNLDVGTDGGSGGFSGYGNASADSSDFDDFRTQYAPPGFGKKPASAGGSIAGENAMLTAEVNGSDTKSLFAMTTAAIKSRCVRRLLNRCGP